MNKKQCTLETRKNLIQAFWEIYRNKNIRDMTIAEVAQKAGYHRRTFYRYFKSLDEVLNELEDSARTLGRHLEDPALFREQILSNNGEYSLEYLQTHFEYIRKFLDTDGDQSFISRSIEAMLPLARQSFACPENEGLLDYAFAYLVGGGLGTYGLWFNRNKEIPELKITALFDILHNHGPNAILNPEGSPEIREALQDIQASLRKTT